MLISSTEYSAVLISGGSSDTSISTSISVVLSADKSLSKLRLFSPWICVRLFFLPESYFMSFHASLGFLMFYIFEVSQSLVDSFLFKLVEY